MRPDDLMETANFTCGHCGNLMAVTVDLLGRAVRCPHCEQVVLAPTPIPEAPPAPPEPEGFQFTPPDPTEEDSIFASKPCDDIFEDTKPTPLELPPELLAATAPESPPPRSASFAFENPGPAPSSVDSNHHLATHDPLAFDAAPNETAEQAELSPSAPALSVNDAFPRTTDETPAKRSDFALDSRRASASTLATWLPIFLVPYAILMTIVAIYLYFQLQQRPHPLEYLPDNYGEHPGVKQNSQNRSQVFERWDPDSLAVPSRLKVPLGKTLRIGDAIEVTPLRVEKRRITFCYDPPRHDPEPSQRDALVLTLRLRNVSADESFYPTDPSFDARWDHQGPKPYTLLEVGTRRFYGGAIPWRPHAATDGSRESAREYIQGQESDNRPLGPGEARQTAVSTNPDDPSVLQALQRYQGALLWRVQLRRGLVAYNGRELSASAVIGVPFTKAEVR